MWDLLFSAAGGGVLGLVGTGIKSFTEHKKAEQQITAEEQRTNARLAEMDKELELAKFRGSLDLELQDSSQDAQALTTAIEAESRLGENASKWVNDVRGMVRPVLTIMLTIMAFVKPDDDDIVWMASTAVTFWFGDRPRKK